MRLNFNYLIYIILITFCFNFIAETNAQNQVFVDDFTSCSFGDNWEWQAVDGSQGIWVVEKLQNSIDESCSLTFVDNLSQKGDTTIMEIKSKWLLSYDYEELNVAFDLIFFKNDAQPHTFDFIIDYGNGEELINTYDKHVFKGNDLTAFVRQEYKLKVVPGTELQLVFRYNGHGFKSSFIQMDNINVNGPIIDDCNYAYQITSLGECLRSNNVGADFSIDQPRCSNNNTSGMWFQYISEFTGFLKITTDAEFNDAIALYHRGCDKDFEIACSDRDEYGFESDELYGKVRKGEYYFVRVSGVNNDFSVAEGDFCFQMERFDSLPAMSTPINDWCINAHEIFVDSLCLAGTNINADMDGPIPSLNERSRADIWYYFDYTGDNSDEVIISTNADFSDVITIFIGDCNQLEEISCQEEGGVALMSDLENGQRYYIQVSSYFSTLEGNVCMDLYGFKTDSPDNDSCIQALQVDVDGVCVEATNKGADLDGMRASCLLKADADIWFEFVSPPSGNIVLYPEAQFLYNVAIFQGNCDSLVEVFCESSTNLCEGFLRVSSLEPNEKYIIQISSAFQSSGLITGDICLQIYSKENAPEFKALSIEVKEECIVGVLSRLTVDIKGGKGNYIVQGFDPQKLYEPGEQYVISAEDENGCIVIAENTIDCESTPICKNDDFAVVVNPDCQVDSYGLNTGFVTFDFSVEHSSGSLDYYGTDKGTLLAHGDEYKIYVIDLLDSCLIIMEGVIDCPPFDCSSSVMTLDLSFNCIDSLLRAELILEAKDGYGQYKIVGHQEGELFENGDTVISTAIDAKGCEITTTTIVTCAFDSCVYSQLLADVSFECLTNKYGNETGYAVMSINHNGGIGQVDYSGLNDGDTLFFGDKYELIAIDEWGCTSIVEGEIDCEQNTAVNNLVGGDDILLYPNPTRNMINISWENVKMNINNSYCFTSQGDFVKNFIPIEIKDDHVQYDVNDLSPGVYFIKIQIKKGVIIKKFVKL